MIVFKSFFKVISHYKTMIIFYTILLVTFGGFSMKANTNVKTFTDTKPNIIIVNKDKGNILTDNLVKYLDKNCNIIKVKNDKDSINDALFYRDVSYIIYIPSGYGDDLINNKKPIIDIKSCGDYNSSLAEMILKKYLKVQNIYLYNNNDINDVINNINNSFKKESNINISTSVDTNKLSKTATFFNFASYSIMAVIMFIICLTLNSFHSISINKKVIISSMNYKKYNRLILSAGFIYSLFIWLIYVILSIILLGSSMFSLRGVIYIFNLFIFTFCTLTIALLISGLINNKNAVNGVVNVIALGSAFLCGAFVPAEFLPDMVLKIAHILPTYWYVNTNDLLKDINVINLKNLYPVFINMFVIIVFSLLFIIINNIITKHKRKIG